MKRLLLFLSLVFISFYILDGFCYRDKVSLIYPIKTESLKIRRDKFGDGHFNAKRKNGRKHKGIDILAAINTPVRAAEDGWAVTRFDKYGYGKYIRIYHNVDLATVYAHLNSTTLWPLEKVRQGDIIGYSGNTGNARCKGLKPHLHFELRKQRTAIDPLKDYLR